MSKSRITYPAAGTGPYAIPFGFLSDSHVLAYVDDVLDTGATVDGGLSQITLSLAPVTTVLIKRSTPTTPIVNYVDGSSIRETNLDRSSLQFLYVSEELEDSQLDIVSDGVADGSVTYIKLASDVTDTLDTIATKADDADLQFHIAASNPHSITKTTVGLSNVDNTTDLNKPISTATQAALDLKLESADISGKQDQDATLQSIADLAGSQNGILVKKVDGTVVRRSIPTSSTITVTNPYGEDSDFILAVNSNNIAPLYSNVQSKPAQLTGLVSIGTTPGLYAQTGPGTGAVRTITAGAGISVTNGNGASGNPTITAEVTQSELDVTNSAVALNTAKVTFPEAPVDGSEYVRKDAAWAVATGGGGGITDAPSDGTEYVRQDAAWVPNSGGTAPELGQRPIYNALTDPDSTIVADYTDRLTPGTDQMAAIESWIEGGLAAGKRVFYFPPGHYNIQNQHTNAVGINGYDDVVIYGIPGETVFHTPQGFDLKGKNFYVFGFGMTAGATGRTRGGTVSGITFINDPYTTFSSVNPLDGDIKWGWKFYELHRTSQAYEKGDYTVSSDDNWLILVTGPGTSDATEPTWSAGTTTDGTCTVVVTALNNWLPLTAYAQGAHVKTTLTTGGSASKGNLHGAMGDVRSIMWAANAGTSGNTTYEPQLCLPSEDGYAHANADYGWNWLSFGSYTENSRILKCEFAGMAGFSQAGGSAMGLAGGFGDRPGGLVEDCYFHDAQYGGVVTGGFDDWTFRNCRHYKMGGWGYCWGTYNAHSYYTQGARNLWDQCRFDHHFYGLDVKIHGNQPNNDNWQNRIVNCEFRNYGWGSVQFVGGGEIYSESLADGAHFILSATSGSSESAIMEKMGVVSNCTFRIFKPAWDDWDWRRPSARPNEGGAGAVNVDCIGVSVVGCNFVDTHGVDTGSSHPIITGGSTPASVTGCNFVNIFRHGIALDGQVSADNCTFDFRAVLGFTTGVKVGHYCRLTNSTIMGTTTVNPSSDAGLVSLGGRNAVIDNNLIVLDGVGHPVHFGSGSGGSFLIENIRFTNNIIEAPSGTIYAYPRSDARHFLFENNVWNISSWGYKRLAQENHKSWIWKNETGNLFTSFSDNTLEDFNSGIVRMIDNPSNAVRTYGDLVDHASVPVTDSASIVGVVKGRNGYPVYLAFASVSENANHWIRSSAQVTLGDWMTMDGTLAGRIKPNGTTGSTTRPSSGIQARVINVGSASAGAGNCQVEVFEWNRVSPAGGGLDATDIDTLSELNGILTDATLIDTADSRLSDARTPTAHTHTASEVTDFDTEVANNSAVTANTAKVSFPEAPNDGSEYVRKNLAWAIKSGASGDLVSTNNLSDVADPATALANLGGASAIGGGAYLGGNMTFLPGTGKYIGNVLANALTTSAGVANTKEIGPFLSAYSFSTTTVAVSVSTLIASAQCCVVLYGSDNYGRPSTFLAQSANIDCSTTGTKTAAMSFSFEAGKLYWLGVWHSSTATIRCGNASGNYTLGWSTAATPSSDRILRNTETFGGTASDWTYSTGDHVSNRSLPLVLIRVS